MDGWIGFASPQEQWSYAGILVFLGLGLVISLAFLVLGGLFGGSYPDAEKNSPYECGFSHIGSLTSPFPIPFYLVAIFFIVFDVEISLLFPWALSLYQVGWCGFFSAGLLLVSLAVGFVYELCSGALEWE